VSLTLLSLLLLLSSRVCFKGLFGGDDDERGDVDDDEDDSDVDESDE
jgi:hypothetical protein